MGAVLAPPATTTIVSTHPVTAGPGMAMGMGQGRASAAVTSSTLAGVELAEVREVGSCEEEAELTKL